MYIIIPIQVQYNEKFSQQVQANTQQADIISLSHAIHLFLLCEKNFISKISEVNIFLRT